MTNIIIKQREAEADAWIFAVECAGVNYTITAPKEYWKKLTGGTIEPEEFVRKSFAFLLAREPQKSILREFALPVIQTYFPEYEAKITSQ